jgi:hypothetical protein
LSLLHPRLRIPAWVAIAILASAYVIRAVFVRGGDFRPDLPLDLVIVLLLAGLLGLRALLQRAGWDRDEHDDRSRGTGHDSR